MPDENVDKWTQKGHIYLWRYEENARNYPSWHLFADEAFRDGFEDLIESMMTAKFNCQKLLNITSPNKEILSIANNRNGAARWKSPKTVVLKYQKDNFSDDYFSLEESENTVIIFAGRQKLGLLKQCVSNIQKGNDFSIEIGNTQLWLW